MRDEYRSIAPLYDPLLSPFFRTVRREVADYLVNAGCTRVLDMCCGTGEQAMLLGRRSMDVLGVDLSPAMLRQASARAGDRTLFVLGDASRLPLRDRGMDAAVATMALHEMDGDVRHAAFHAMCRAASMVVVVDYAARGSEERPSPATRTGRFLCRVPERLAGARHYAAYRDFMDRGGIDGLFEDHGLSPSFRKDFLFATLRMAVADVRDYT